MISCPKALSISQFSFDPKVSLPNRGRNDTSVVLLEALIIISSYRSVAVTTTKEWSLALSFNIKLTIC